jgi:RimJ/RimL family protein N-acetyltransferase
MIADPSVRRKGIATTALRMMMGYTKQQLNLHDFEARIKRSNAESLHLFEKLGFVKVKEVEAFDEATFLLESESLDSATFSNWAAVQF